MVTLGLVVLGIFTIKERKGNEIEAQDELENERNETGLKRTFSVIKTFPKENKRSILFMVVNIFFGAFGFSIIQAFISSLQHDRFKRRPIQSRHSVYDSRSDRDGRGFPGGSACKQDWPPSDHDDRLCGVDCYSNFDLFAQFASSVCSADGFLTAAFYGLWYVNGFVTLIDAAPDDKTIGTMTA